MDVNALLPALDLVAFEQLPDGRFLAVTGIPRWCRAVRPLVRWDAPLVIDDVFPFLAVFLPDAERIWKAGGTPLKSDIWAERPSEASVEDADVHVMAVATRVLAARALLIVQSEALYEEQQGLIQRARELQMTHRALMREIEEKDILIHAIIHDLAAPLHSIIGVLSLLDEGPKREPESKWIRVALEAASRQRELISEILEVFAAERSALGERVTMPVALSDVLERVVAERAPTARSRSLRLEVERGAALPRVIGDEMRLFRVLTNLVDNALRYSPPGGLVRLATRSEDGTLILTVEDEGTGVRPDVLPRLFEKLARSRDGTGGTGLGLFYCRITVENWGGGIGYEEREGGGARFWIRLNVADAPRDRTGGSDGKGADTR